MTPSPDPNLNQTQPQANINDLSVPSECLIPQGHFEKDTVLRTMHNLGISQASGFYPSLINSIDNSRIPRNSPSWEPQEQEGLQILSRLQKTEVFRPIVHRLNEIVLEQYFAPVHTVLGDYPLGFSLTVESEMDAAEREEQRAPVQFLASLAPNSSMTSESSRVRLAELQSEELRQALFNAYVEEYQHRIAPQLPSYLTDTPHFGGVSFRYAWQDCWQNPGSMMLLMKDVWKNLTPATREKPYEILSQFREEVLNPLSTRANDLFRNIFLGSIYPILTSAGIGVPSSTSLEVAFHRQAKDSSEFEENVRLLFSLDYDPTLSREFMAQFGHNVIRQQFRHLIYSEFGAFCQREVFPTIARLPADVGEFCLGLKFKLNKDFSFFE